MEELDDRIEDETQDLVEFGDDVELESEIAAIVGGLEPIEGIDALEVLATRKQTRTAMVQEKLNRRLRTPVRQDSEAFNSFIGDGFQIPELKDESEASDGYQASNVNNEALHVIGLHGSGDKISACRTGRWQTWH